MSVASSVKRILGVGPPIDIGGEPRIELPQDDLHACLKEERRRLVIRHLIADTGGTSTTADLADYVTMVQTGADSIREISGDERKPVYVGLYQAHLPKLDELGVIQYDKPRGTVFALPLAYDLHDVIRAIDRVLVEEGDSA